MHFRPKSHSPHRTPSIPLPCCSQLAGEDRPHIKVSHQLQRRAFIPPNNRAQRPQPRSSAPRSPSLTGTGDAVLKETFRAQQDFKLRNHEKNGGKGGAEPVVGDARGEMPTKRHLRTSSQNSAVRGQNKASHDSPAQRCHCEDIQHTQEWTQTHPGLEAEGTVLRICSILGMLFVSIGYHVMQELDF